jgi:hypothetical protein
MADDRRPPATGAPRDPGPAQEEEPLVVGALFLSMVMLILIAGAWAVMFYTLVER